MNEIERMPFKTRNRPNYSLLRAAFIRTINDLGYETQKEFCNTFGMRSNHFANLFKPDSLLTRKKLAYLVHALDKRGAKREALEEVAYLGACCIVELCRLEGICSVSKRLVLDWVREEEIYDV